MQLLTRKLRLSEGKYYLSLVETRFRKVNEKVKILYIEHKNVGFENESGIFAEAVRVKFLKTIKEII